MIEEASAEAAPGSAPSRFVHPRARRIRTRAEFVAAQRASARVHTPHFLLVLALGPEPRFARLGVTVTRKVGGSVQRARCKRLVREAFRLDPTLLPGGIDLFVIAKSGAPALDLAKVQAEWNAVRRHLERKARELLAAAATPPIR